MPPFQGFILYYRETQGVALGYNIAHLRCFSQMSKLQRVDIFRTGACQLPPEVLLTTSRPFVPALHPLILPRFFL